MTPQKIIAPQDKKEENLKRAFKEGNMDNAVQLNNSQIRNDISAGEQADHPEKKIKSPE